jgi:drug/metabolite transporter (DMT)-like permease
MSAQSIIFYRVLFAFAIFFIFIFISRNIKIIELKDKKIYLLLFGILQVGAMLTFFISILQGSVSIAVLLLYTAPVYITILSPWLLKERSTKKGIIALILSLIGILLIVDPQKLDFTQYPVGILAGIASGIIYSFQIMTSKYASSTYSGYSQAFWSFPVAIMILLPVGIAPFDIVLDNLGYLILLSIFPTILAISLYFNGLKKVKAHSASILGLIEPLSAVILSVLILHEQISTLEMIGGAFILAGVALVTTDK